MSTKEIILHSIAPVLPWLLVVLVLFILFALAYIFKKLSAPRAEAEQARQALDLEVSLIGKLFRLGRRKTDAVAAVQDPNALTISRPIPAVPPPETKP